MILWYYASKFLPRQALRDPRSSRPLWPPCRRRSAKQARVPAPSPYPSSPETRTEQGHVWGARLSTPTKTKKKKSLPSFPTPTAVLTAVVIAVEHPRKRYNSSRTYQSIMSTCISTRQRQLSMTTLTQTTLTSTINSTIIVDKVLLVIVDSIKKTKKVTKYSH